MKKILTTLLAASLSVSMAFSQTSWITFGSLDNNTDAIGNLESQKRKTVEKKSDESLSKEKSVSKKEMRSISKNEAKIRANKMNVIANGGIRTTKDSTGVTFQWGVLENTNHPILYIVEKSTDGALYTYFHSLQGEQLESTVLYSFTTSNPGNGMSYFRLKKVFSDGHIEYSNSVMIYTPHGTYEEGADETRSVSIERM